MYQLTEKTKQNVSYLEHDGLEVLHTAAMVLMKNKETGNYVVVDASGKAWNAEMMWKRK